MTRRSTARVLFLACTFGLFAAPAAAQRRPPTFASPFLPATHWARPALRRLAGIGITPVGFDAGTGSLTRRQAARAFAAAAERARTDGSPAASLARAYLDRFSEEFPRLRVVSVGASAERGLVLLGSRLVGAYRTRAADPWVAYHPVLDRAAPLRFEEAVAGVGRLELGLALGRHGALHVAPLLGPGGWALQGGHLVGGWGALGAWVGRRRVRYGPGSNGGLILSGAAALDGGGLFLRDPVRLPGFLRALGPVRFELLVARLEENGEFAHPWLWGMRGSLAPHPRLRIGFTRGAIFGGEGNAPVTLRNLAFLLIGKHAGSRSEFENQVAAVDVRYRPPLGGLPLVLYLEWGFDDSAGAWREGPGILAGAFVAAMPGLPAVSLGLERTVLVDDPSRSPGWYQNGFLPGGWTAAGEALGHPLGGNGSEWALYGAADLSEARVRLRARAFARNRGVDNLFAPDRVGESVGGSLRSELRILPSVEMLTEAAVESGDGGWREFSTFVGLRLLF